MSAISGPNVGHPYLRKKNEEGEILSGPGQAAEGAGAGKREAEAACFGLSLERLVFKDIAQDISMLFICQ
ncbi:MAG: hypothetical protein WA708_14765 [Acidobacteriaceae bacterium]